MDKSIFAESTSSRELTEYIQSKCDTWQVPGLALMMAQNGEPVYRQMYGYRNVAEQLPVTEETVFGVASVTKSVAALAIMQAQDQGRLSVHDKIVKWLPELRGMKGEYAGEVTIHHLMTHTAGFPGMDLITRARAMSLREDKDLADISDMPDPFQLTPIRNAVELAEALAEVDIPWLGAPGRVFNYSNESFGLLQGILERAADCDFLDFVERHILQPLHMEKSVFRTSDLAQLPEVTEIYGRRMEDGVRKVFHSPAWWDVGGIYSNGSMKSTVQDLIRYLEVYRTGGLVNGQRILSEAGVAEMTTAHVKLPDGRGYGYGLFVNTHHGMQVVSHGGGVKGVSSEVWVAPETNVTVAVLCNLAGVLVAQLAQGALNAASGLPVDAQTVDYGRLADEFADTRDAAAWQAFAGQYRSGEGGQAEVTVEDGKLVLSMYGASQALRPYDRDKFMDTAGSPVSFLRDDAGQMTGLFVGVRVLQRVDEGGM